MKKYYLFIALFANTIISNNNDKKAKTLKELIDLSDKDKDKRFMKDLYSDEIKKYFDPNHEEYIYSNEYKTFNIDKINEFCTKFTNEECKINCNIYLLINKLTEKFKNNYYFIKIHTNYLSNLNYYFAVLRYYYFNNKKIIDNNQWNKLKNYISKLLLHYIYYFRNKFANYFIIRDGNAIKPNVILPLKEEEIIILYQIFNTYTFQLSSFITKFLGVEVATKFNNSNKSIEFHKLIGEKILINILFHEINFEIETNRDITFFKSGTETYLSFIDNLLEIINPDYLYYEEVKKIFFLLDFKYLKILLMELKTIGEFLLTL